MTRDSKGFDYSAFPPGYYDKILKEGHPVRSAWHAQKFRRVIECLPVAAHQSILDIGCFAGSFLSLIGQDHFSRQVGVDILPSQVDYARRAFGTEFREFIPVKTLDSIDFAPQSFDCVTLIEVIEHLSQAEIDMFLSKSAAILKPGGKLILTTPNYTSLWPLVELIINRWSDVSYEEQHITRFNFFTALGRLRQIHPRLDHDFKVEFITTTHFLAPFLAGISRTLSDRISSAVDHKKWRFPFGCMIMISLTRRTSYMARTRSIPLPIAPGQAKTGESHRDVRLGRTPFR